MERVAIYSRVSTADQCSENQLLLLRNIAQRNGWTIAQEYVDDGRSGTHGRKERPALDDMCKAMVQRRFSRVLVWDISRLGRSLQDLVEFMGEMRAVGCDLYVHQSSLDTSTPSGRMMFQMVGVFAEFEREMISERIKLGLARARKQGKAIGRPTKITEDLIGSVREALSRQKPYSQIAKEYGVSKMTVCRIRNAYLEPKGSDGSV